VLAVIFKATVAGFDEEYQQTAQRLKTLAFEKYGCREFVSVTEGDEEIAISYWDTEQQIRDWKNDPEHRAAQARGREKWYRSWSIDVCEVRRRK
jgi:heme-degrading monooxygenase HmoA